MRGKAEAPSMASSTGRTSVRQMKVRDPRSQNLPSLVGGPHGFFFRVYTKNLHNIGSGSLKKELGLELRQFQCNRLSLRRAIAWPVQTCTSLGLRIWSVEFSDWGLRFGSFCWSGV